jgi:hypothetical protein
LILCGPKRLIKAPLCVNLNNIFHLRCHCCFCPLGLHGRNKNVFTRGRCKRISAHVKREILLLFKSEALSIGVSALPIVAGEIPQAKGDALLFK